MKSFAANERKMLNLQKVLWSSISMGWITFVILGAVSAGELSTKKQNEFIIPRDQGTQVSASNNGNDHSTYTIGNAYMPGEKHQFPMAKKRGVKIIGNEYTVDDGKHSRYLNSISTSNFMIY